MDVNHSRGRATLAAVLVTALAFPCAISIAAGSRVDYQVIHPIAAPRSVAPSYFAIRSNKELEAWWNERDPAPSTAPAMPKIEFDHYTLIVANAGTKPSSGFGVAITSVRIGDTVDVSVLETMPGVICPRATEITHAEIFALIPETHLPIRFNIMTAAVDCNARRNVEAK